MFVWLNEKRLEALLEGVKIFVKDVENITQTWHLHSTKYSSFCFG